MNDRTQNGAAAREQRIAEGLTVARELAAEDVPIFRSISKMDELGEWIYPRAWQKSKPGAASLRAIERWGPGYALCAVMGVVYDAVDVDVQKGGHLDDIDLSLRESASRTARTPSGGWHLLVPCTGLASGPMIWGDLKAGRADGSGRGFIFISPTTSFSKPVPGCPGTGGKLRRYRWES